MIGDIIAVLFVVALIIIAAMLFWLAYKIYKIPNEIWEKSRKNPTEENLKKIMEHIKE